VIASSGKSSDSCGYVLGSQGSPSNKEIACPRFELVVINSKLFFLKISAILISFRILMCEKSGAVLSVIMEAVCTSETSVYFNATTRRCIPENSKLNFNCYLNLQFEE
jgi:hypothetical protein